MIEAGRLLEPLRRMHDSIRDAVVSATERQQLEELADIRRDSEGDTIYAIDVVSEEMLLGFFEELARQHSFVLIAEGSKPDVAVAAKAMQAIAAAGFSGRADETLSTVAGEPKKITLIGIGKAESLTRPRGSGHRLPQPRPPLT